MNPEIRNGELLSSWKEIAAFLKCSIRSCIRWEKRGGLPIHRSSDAQGSRVYAYKKELEDWLKTQANGHVSAPESVPRRKRRRISPWLLAIIPAVLLVIFFFLKPSPGGRPFRMAKCNIVTAEPDGPGRLRVWGNKDARTYRPIWEITSSKTNTVRHSTLAVGDIDGDQRSEVVVPTYAKATFTRGEKQAVYFKIFLNFYKQGTSGLWKTTFFADGDCLWEAGNYWMNEVILANLDGDPAAEVILKTATQVGIYDYSPESGEFRLATFMDSFVENVRVSLKSVAAVHGAGYGEPSIVVSADEMPDAGGPPFSGRGRLFLLQMLGGVLRLSNTLEVDATMTPKALVVGDVVYGGPGEIYSTACRRDGNTFRAYLLGWTLEGDAFIDVPLPDSESNDPVFAALGIGDFAFDAGDDILVAAKPGKLSFYSWRENALLHRGSHEVVPQGASVNSICIGDSDGDGRQEIVLGGANLANGPQSGRFYLEVLGYSDSKNELTSLWKRVGGGNGETEVWSAKIGRK